MKKTVLVTGGTGFIGHHLVNALLQQRYDVRISTRKTQPSNRNIPCYPVGDIGPDTEWSSSLKGVSAVVHLAGRAHILNETDDNPLREFTRINTEGTLQLAKEAVKVGVRRFIYVSSIGVNGRYTNNEPFNEISTPRPHNDYALSKLAAENGLTKLAEKHNLEVVIVRPPLVYGSGVGANFFRLLKIAHKRYPLPLRSVKNRRSLISVDNLTDFLICCLEHPKATDELFLVSDGQDVSTSELIRYLSKYMHKKARLFPFPSPLLYLTANLFNRQALADSLVSSLQIDIEKANRLLGWQPQVKIDDALCRTVQYFLASLSQ